MHFHEKNRFQDKRCKFHQILIRVFCCVSAVIFLCSMSVCAYNPSEPQAFTHIELSDGNLSFCGFTIGSVQPSGLPSGWLQYQRLQGSPALFNVFDGDFLIDSPDYLQGFWTYNVPPAASSISFVVGCSYGLQPKSVFYYTSSGTWGPITMYGSGNVRFFTVPASSFQGIFAVVYENYVTQMPAQMTFSCEVRSYDDFARFLSETSSDLDSIQSSLTLLDMDLNQFILNFSHTVHPAPVGYFVGYGYNTPDSIILSGTSLNPSIYNSSSSSYTLQYYLMCFGDEFDRVSKLTVSNFWSGATLSYYLDGQSKTHNLKSNPVLPDFDSISYIRFTKTLAPNTFYPDQILLNFEYSGVDRSKLDAASSAIASHHQIETQLTTSAVSGFNNTNSEIQEVLSAGAGLPRVANALAGMGNMLDSIVNGFGSSNFKPIKFLLFASLGLAVLPVLFGFALGGIRRSDRSERIKSFRKGGDR